MLLALYPFKTFRRLLRKLRLIGHHRATIHLFVKKFYSCYRDGLNGGKDMRRFASLYFFLRFAIAIFAQGTLEFLGVTGPDDDAELLYLHVLCFMFQLLY